MAAKVYIMHKMHLVNPVECRLRHSRVGCKKFASSDVIILLVEDFRADLGAFYSKATTYSQI